MYCNALPQIIVFSIIILHGNRKLILFLFGSFLEGGKKTKRLEVISCLHLPEKSHLQQVITPRRMLSKVDISPATSLKRKCINFSIVCKKIKEYVDKRWTCIQNDEKIMLHYMEVGHYIPRYESTVENCLEFTITVYGYLLPNTRNLYKVNRRSIVNISIPSLITEIQTLILCPGIKENNSRKCTSHTLILKPNPKETDERHVTKTFCRSKECMLFIACK